MTSKKSKNKKVTKRKKNSYRSGKNQKLNGKGVLFFAIGAIILFSASCMIFMPEKSLNYIHNAFQFISSSDENAEIPLSAPSETTVSFRSSTSTQKTTSKTTSSTTSKSSSLSSKTSTTTKASTAITTKKITGETHHVTVYLKSQRVVVYDKSENIIISFICSSGRTSSPTQTGSYSIHHKYRWRLMKGDCYAQYASAFSGEYLFHSVPYFQLDASTLMNGEYDLLGTPASAGCIRLCLRDAKWIYDNCPIGANVLITDTAAPKGIDPDPIVPRKKSEMYKGWDPTDTSPKSPYNQ